MDRMPRPCTIQKITPMGLMPLLAPYSGSVQTHAGHQQGRVCRSRHGQSSASAAKTGRRGVRLTLVVALQPVLEVLHAVEVGEAARAAAHRAALTLRKQPPVTPPAPILRTQTPSTATPQPQRRAGMQGSSHRQLHA